MTLRSVVSHVARRSPFIAAGYLGACSAATFVGLFAAALIFVTRILLTGDAVAIGLTIVALVLGVVPAWPPF